MKRTIRLSEGRIREAVEAEMNNGDINNAELEQRLANGEDLHEVFDYADYSDNDYANVKLNGKWNHINTEGRLISDTWFDWVERFREGFAQVKLKGKYNFIDTEGHIISDTWFDGVDDFTNGFAEVNFIDKWNFINREGEIVSDTWFDWVDEFHRGGYAVVQLNGKYYEIDTECNLYDYETGEPVSL